MKVNFSSSSSGCLCGGDDGDDDDDDDDRGHAESRQSIETLGENTQEALWSCDRRNGPPAAEPQRFCFYQNHQAAAERLHLPVDLQVRKHTQETTTSLIKDFMS